ncbi:hypothetical protein WAF17_04335 [Bernardetia sp. ABR2-2B]|uniref:hypothetical protein n=1 Tax=Bernardetia sp. ABR2-2B TaxID=3127472 RepID=UPI0030CF034D
MEEQRKKFNSTDFVLRIIVDFIILCSGSFLFCAGLGAAIIGESNGVTAMAIGGVFIALFILIRLWRKEYRERNSDR